MFNRHLAALAALLPVGAQAVQGMDPVDFALPAALTELGAKYNDFNRLAYYGYTPEQIQNMYRFAQMDALGYTW